MTRPLLLGLTSSLLSWLLPAASLTPVVRPLEAQIPRAFAAPAEGHLTADDGVRLHYQILGNGADTLVIPIAVLLAPELERLASDRTVIFYDLRGRGRSDAVPDSTRVGVEQDLRSRIDGEAWKRIEQMRREGLDRSEPERFCRALEQVFVPAILGDPGAYAGIRSDRCANPNVWPLNLDRNFRLVQASMGAHDWRAEVPSLTMPTLIVHRTADAVAIDGAREWAARPNARLLAMPGVGHMPIVERPEVFLSTVETFLRGEWPEGAEGVAPDLAARDLPSYEALVRIFDFDASQPLDVREVSVRRVDGAAVHDLSFASPSSPSAMLFQFGAADDLVARDDALSYYETAGEPKEIRWYESGHDLPVAARRDRAGWLASRFGLER